MAIDATFELALNFAAQAETQAVDQAGLENARHQRVIDSLPDGHYARALAIGASPALCRKLGGYCDALSTTPETERLRAGRLELIVLCDALRRADGESLRDIAAQCVGALQRGGHLVLVNWVGDDAAAAALIDIAGAALLPMSRQRTPHYRVDVLEKA